MFRQLLLTTSTVLWLWGAYAVYSAFVTVRLQTERNDSPDLGLSAADLHADPRVTDPANHFSKQLLQDAPWIDPPENAPEEQQVFQMQIGNRLKIFSCKIHSPPTSSELRFKPFAMVVDSGTQGTAPTEPVMIVAEEAVIEFANKVDFRGSPGRIVGGQFRGKVLLRGPDNLSLIGDKFFFEEQIQSPSSILYSDSMVNFTYGPHSGRGVQFNVEFIRLKNEIPKDIPAIGGIEKVWINRDVHLELADPKGSLAPPAPGRAAARKEEKLIVDAQGRMTFDLQQNRLTLEDQVRLVHPDSIGKQDSVNCELLVLNLIRSNSDSVRSSIAASEPESRFSNWFPRKLELGSITATGNPEKLVRFSSTRHDVRGDMRSLQYDLKNRQAILLEDKRDGVHIVHGIYDIRSPEIRIQHGPDYEILNVECLKAGKIASRGDSKSPFQAEWNDRMTKHPSAFVPAEDVLELHGRVHIVQQSEKMSLDAEHLLVGFLIPDPKLHPPGEMKNGPVGSSPSRKSPGSDLNRVQILWINAQESVRMVHPEVVANTGKLSIRYQETLKPLPHKDDEIATSSVATHRKANSPRKKNTGKPNPVSPGKTLSAESAQADGTPPEHSSETPVVGDPPPELTAGELQVLILRNAERQHLAEVTGQTRFEMRQRHLDGSEPLDVRGERMQLLNHPERERELLLQGQPVILKDRGNTLAGPVIKVLREKNRADVVGAGYFSGLVENPLKRETLAKSGMLMVKWREKVTFDGKTISFFDRVVCELEGSSMSCPEMIVDLSEPISFNGPELKSVKNKRPEIRRLECKHQVVFEQNSLDRENRQTRAVGDVTNFTMDLATGKTLASGPGTLRVWRQGNQNGKSTGPASLLQTSYGDRSDSDRAEWEFHQIRFRKRMQGNIEQKFTVFEGPVQVIYGPVSLPTEIIPLENLSPEGGTMDCNELQISQIGSGESENIGLLGKGNVRIEGFGFHALADEIDHDQSKGQYKLRAHGRGIVNLWYRDLDSGQDKRASGEAFDFRVVNGAVKELKGHRTSVIDGAE